MKSLKTRCIHFKKSLKGLKDDNGKIDYTLLKFEAFKGMIRVLVNGVSKYGKDNWLNLCPYRTLKACFRHNIQYLTEQYDFDKNFKSSHLDNQLCELMFTKYLVEIVGCKNLSICQKCKEKCFLFNYKIEKI